MVGLAGNVVCSSSMVGLAGNVVSMTGNVCAISYSSPPVARPLSPPLSPLMSPPRIPAPPFPLPHNPSFSSSSSPQRLTSSGYCTYTDIPFYSNPALSPSSSAPPSSSALLSCSLASSSPPTNLPDESFSSSALDESCFRTPMDQSVCFHEIAPSSEALTPSIFAAIDNTMVVSPQSTVH
eukprot:GHVS01010682.1.p1 GENE.GHVS01010682.1~~GHVS01010682.1.p1  ORF type:complete len:192 (-),score=66.57 GHVS01010682.1:41-580(-)